jgi:hypothetical protein
MAFFTNNKDNNDNYFSNGYSDSWFSAKDGNNADEWNELRLEDLDGIAGGAWTGEETELSMLCAKCRCVRVFKKDEWGRWRCSECNGTETMRYQDL